jgi:Ca2+-binding EF-hand superfamily protein
MSRVQFAEALAQVLGLQMSWFSANTLCEALAGGKSAITLATFEEHLVSRVAETTTQPEWRKLTRWLAQFIELSDVDMREALAHFDPQHCGWISAARLCARAQQMGRSLSHKLAQAIMQAYGSRGVEDRLSPEQFAQLLVDCVLQRTRELEGKEGLRAEAKRARCEAFLKSAYHWDPHETQPEWRELLDWLALFVEHSGVDAQQAFDHFDHHRSGAVAAARICAGLARHTGRPLDRKLARAILQAYGNTQVEDTLTPEQFTNLLVDAVLHRVRIVEVSAPGPSEQARLSRCHAFLQSAYVWTENTFALRTRAPRVPVNMDRAQLRALRHVRVRQGDDDDMHWRDDTDGSGGDDYDDDDTR